MVLNAHHTGRSMKWTLLPPNKHKYNVDGVARGKPGLKRFWGAIFGGKGVLVLAFFEVHLGFKDLRWGPLKKKKDINGEVLAIKEAHVLSAIFHTYCHYRYGLSKCRYVDVTKLLLALENTFVLC